MNIPSCSEELQYLFESSDKHYVTCPHCRAEGHDTSGSNLKIGDGRVHCFRGPTHGDELFRDLVKARSLDPHSRFYKPKSDNRLHKNDKLSYLDNVPAGRAKWFDPEGLLTAAAAVEDDLNYVVDVLKRCLVSRDLRGRELLKITLAAGNVLNHVKHRVDHGQWKQTLEAAGYTTEGDVRWAQRAMELVRDVDDPLSFKSVNAALVSKRKPKKKRQEAQKTKLEALERENEALVNHVEKMTRPPSDSELQTKVTELEREKRVLISRNSRLAQDKRALEDEVSKLKAANNALLNELEAYREREAIQAEPANAT